MCENNEYVWTVETLPEDNGDMEGAFDADFTNTFTFRTFKGSTVAIFATSREQGNHIWVRFADDHAASSTGTSKTCVPHPTPPPTDMETGRGGKGLDSTAVVLLLGLAGAAGGAVSIRKT